MVKCWICQGGTSDILGIKNDEGVQSSAMTGKEPHIIGNCAEPFAAPARDEFRDNSVIGGRSITGSRSYLGSIEPLELIILATLLASLGFSNFLDELREVRSRAQPNRREF